MRTGLTLRDLGERAIVEWILAPRYASGMDNFGDDCAAIRLADDDWLVTSTDPCPTPMAALLGFSDPYYRGWLLAAINLSDLAAAGAQPIGLLTSLVLPSDLPVSDLNRLLEGVDDCCAAAGTRVLGGNLKEGGAIDLTATAFGRCLGGRPLSRRGASPGDRVVVIGELGQFWAGYFALTRAPDLAEQSLLTPLLTPVPRVAAGAALRRAGLVRACIDNSDGLYPSLVSLASANGLGIRLDFATVAFQPAVTAVAKWLDVDAVRFALGWGDWQLVAAVAAGDEKSFEDVCGQIGVRTSVIGVFTDSDEVVLDHRGRSGRLMRLDSQRFAPDSWFTVGIDHYARRMLDAELCE